MELEVVYRDRIRQIGELAKCSVISNRKVVYYYEYESWVIDLQ